MGDRASDQGRRYLGAADFVPVTQAHIMADTESLGEAGVEWLERWPRCRSRAPRAHSDHHRSARHRLRRGARLKQQAWMLALERRAIAAFEALGVLMTDTCINYQTIMPPVRGEHMAYGDTGVVIYSNSVLRRALELRGRAVGAGRRPDRPHAALRLSSRRSSAAPRCCCSVDYTPRELNEWGALGGIVGRLAGDYWQVPALIGHRPRAHVRRAEAFRRGAGELRLGRAVPHGRRHAGGAARSTIRGAAGDCGARRRRGRSRAHSRRPIARASTPSMWWCSRRRSSAWSRCASSPACSTAGARRSRCSW